MVNKNGRRHHEKSQSSHPRCHSSTACFKLFSKLRSGEGSVAPATDTSLLSQPLSSSQSQEDEEEEEEQEEDVGDADNLHADVDERKEVRQERNGAGSRRLDGSLVQPLSLPRAGQLASYHRIPSFSPPPRTAAPFLPPSAQLTTAVQSLLHLAPALSAQEERKESRAAVEAAELRAQLQRAREEVQAMNATMAWMQKGHMVKEEQWKVKEAAWARDKAALERSLLFLQQQLTQLKAPRGKDTGSSQGSAGQPLSAVPGAPPSPLVMPSAVCPVRPPALQPRPSPTFTHAASSPFVARNGSAESPSLSSAPSTLPYPVQPQAAYPPASPFFFNYRVPFSGFAYPPPQPLQGFGSPPTPLRGPGVTGLVAAPLGAPSLATAVQQQPPSSLSVRRGSEGGGGGKATMKRPSQERK